MTRGRPGSGAAGGQHVGEGGHRPTLGGLPVGRGAPMLRPWQPQVDRQLLGRDPGRRRRHPALAAVPLRRRRSSCTTSPAAGTSLLQDTWTGWPRWPRTASWSSPARRTGRRSLAQLPAARPGRGDRRAVAARLDGRDRAGRRPARAARPRRRHGLVRRRPRDRRPRRVRRRRCGSPSRPPRDGLAGHARASSRPSRPSAFGYIHLGEELPGHAGAHAVREFVEKPSTADRRGVPRDRRATAGTPACSSSGRRCCWTCSPQWHPEFAAALRAIAADPDRLDELWPDAAEDRARPRHRRAGRRRRAGSRSCRRRSTGTTSATSTRWPTLLAHRRRRRGHRVLGDAGAVRRSSTPRGLVVPAVGPGGRGGRARRRRRRRHPGRAAGDDPRAGPGRQADRGELQETAGRPDLVELTESASTERSPGVRSHSAGLGGVGVGVLQHEVVQRLAGDVGAVLEDADLLRRVGLARRRRPTSA